MKISFYGAAQGVTGSNYLVETGSTKFLVDCGLFQGKEEERRLNWQEFPYDPKEIDFVLITHSHIDHIGRVPLLVNKGMQNPIYATAPTRDFAEIFLADTAGLMENEAKEFKMPPLFSEEDVPKAIELFKPVKYHEKFTPAEGIEVEYFDAGHIFGSAFIKITTEGKTVVFSGDLGNPPVPILCNTEFIESADCVLIESTYGNRNHDPAEQRKAKLAAAITETAARGGTVLMPSFAMERTQEILYELNQLYDEEKIHIPVYLDSPLAIKATAVYGKYPELYDEEAKKMFDAGDNFFKFPELKTTITSGESMSIDHDSSPKIIIAGSGMSNGGRIVFHEKKYLPIESTTLLIVGFQVEGTLGRKLIEGATEVNIMGTPIPVHAHIESIDAYSAHADQTKLLNWLSKIQDLSKIIVVHGEETAKNDFAALIKEQKGIEPVIPTLNQTVEI
jgi:metallo-beta-lactamase family protein